MQTVYAAAVDLGATSGRVIVGAYSDNGLELTEVRRFPNAFHPLGANYYWDVGGFVSEIRKGLIEAKKRFPELGSCGVDTWGVDHALVDKTGRLVFPVHAYRDSRTDALLMQFKEAGDEPKLYGWTGLPLINYNTGLQLCETLRAVPSVREACHRVLLLPDYFNFLLSGQMVNEISILSTSQLLDLQSNNLSKQALDYFGIPHSWFGEPSKAGRKLGKVRDIPGLEDVDVVLVPGHDTSCAYEAIPRIGNDLFVSAGTWLLVGSLSPRPAAGPEALGCAISNERSGDGSYRPNRIQLGLWLLEQTAPHFAERPTTGAGWDALADEAAALPAPGYVIDTTDQALFNPKNMREAIDRQLTAKGHKPPASLAGYMRLICDSLGQAVADTAIKFGRLTGQKYDHIIIVGGGSKNSLLCQRVADYSGIPVASYTLEGSTVGNIGYQLLGRGVIPNLDVFRSVVARSVNKKLFHPRKA